MNEKHITVADFDRHIRPVLRYGSGFEHADLERAKGIVSDAIAHVEHKANTKLGMTAGHLDMAMKYLNEEHEGWKDLPDFKKRHIESALRGHFGIQNKIEGEKETV